jgi:hypothetical protein
LLDNEENNIHIHIHEGVSPEAAGAAIAALQHLSGSGDVKVELGLSGEPEDGGATGLVRTVYDESTGKAQALLEYLAEHPGREIPYAEVNSALGLDSPASLSGVLSSFTRRAKDRYGGFKPYESVKVGNQWYLKMPVEVARVVIKLS